MPFEDLELRVIAWAEEKNILLASNPTVQMSKTLEECAEVIRELATFPTDKDALRLEYGDVLVTLIVGMALANIKPTEALQDAYNKIAKRKGRMVGGVFVKES